MSLQNKRESCPTRIKGTRGGDGRIVLAESCSAAVLLHTAPGLNAAGNQRDLSHAPCLHSFGQILGVLKASADRAPFGSVTLVEPESAPSNHGQQEVHASLSSLRAANSQRQATVLQDKPAAGAPLDGLGSGPKEQRTALAGATAPALKVPRPGSVSHLIRAGSTDSQTDGLLAAVREGSGRSCHG